MAYAQQPQNILAVIYDGCIIFKRTVWRVWPLGIALFLLNLWLVMSYLVGFAYHSTLLPEQSDQILWHHLLYPSHLNVHQLPFFINSLPALSFALANFYLNWPNQFFLKLTIFSEDFKFKILASNDPEFIQYEEFKPREGMDFPAMGFYFLYFPGKSLIVMSASSIHPLPLLPLPKFKFMQKQLIEPF